MKSNIGYINSTKFFLGASTWATRVYRDVQRPPFCLTIFFCGTWKLPQTLHRSLSCSSGEFSELGAELWINPLRVHFQLFTSDNDILESWLTQLKQLQVPSTFFFSKLVSKRKTRFLDSRNRKESTIFWIVGIEKKARFFEHLDSRRKHDFLG